MKYIILISIVSIFFNSSLWCQKLSNGPNVELKSPIVTQIEKIGLVPTSLQTGQVSPNINICELKTPEISIPITLNYSNTGLKIGEHASWVGLGWNLFVGGVISQNVKGLSDFEYNGLLNPAIRSQFYNFLNNNMSPFERQMYQWDVVNHFTDSERDVFTFNFMGRNGMFYFDGNGFIKQFHKSDLLINYNHGNSSFIIKDNQGFIYTFDIREVSSVSEGDLTSNNPIIINGYSWYLHTIVSPHQDVITFNYADDAMIGEAGNSAFLTFGATSNSSGCAIDNTCTNRTFDNPYSTTTQKVLSSIESRSGKIIFSTSNSREDLIDLVNGQKGKVLSEVALQDKDGNTISSTQFIYEHFLGLNNIENNRLKLKLLKQFGKSKQNDPLIYKFSYISEFTQFPPLGDVCKDYDHWGYYNGAGNSFTIPSFDASKVNGTAAFYNGADKNANSLFSQYGMLQTIQYPTGGKTEFEYEANVVDLSEYSSIPLFIITSTPSNFKVGGNRIKSIKYFNENGLIVNSQIFEYSKVKSLKYIPNYLMTKDYLHSVTPVAVKSCGNSYQISNRPVNSMPGFHIEYSTVTEKNTTNYKNGYSNTTFFPSEDIGSQSQPFPFVINTSWRSGNILQHENYISITPNSFQKNSQVNNIYHSYLSVPMVLDGTSVKIALNSAGSFNSAVAQYSLGIYSYFSESFNKMSTNQISFDGNLSITKTDNFFYESLNHSQITKQQTILSNGKIQENRLYYVADFEDIVSINFSKLKSKNINPTIRIDKLIDGKLIESNINIPTEYGSPETQFRSLLTSPILYPLDSKNSTMLNTINYEKNSDFKYDVKGNLTQSKVNDKVISYAWGYDFNYPIAEIINSSIEEIAYTSFETNEKGNWQYLNSGETSNSGGVTGKIAYSLSTSSIQRTGLKNNQTYIITYWIKDGSGSVSINGGSGGTPITSKNGWTLYHLDLKGLSSILMSGNAIIDELRLHPKSAQMITYTYLPLVGISSQNDAKNRITYYEYDNFNRLMRIRDEDKNIIKSYNYTYKEKQ